MLGIVAVGVVRESRKFSWHPCRPIGRIAQLYDSTAFLSHFIRPPGTVVREVFYFASDVFSFVSFYRAMHFSANMSSVRPSVCDVGDCDHIGWKS